MSNENKDQNYIRKILYRNDFFEIASIEWNPSSISELHNHGWSNCLILVEEGLFENTLDLGNKTEVQLFEVGQVLDTPVGARHAMRCLSEKGKTLHVYTPKINELSENGKFKADPIVMSILKEELLLKNPTQIDSLRRLLATVRDHAISTHSPYFMNQLFSGVAPQMLLAEELIAQTKTTLATFEASSVFSLIEAQVIESLGEIIGWTNEARGGVCVPGGSAANFMALHCARQRMFPDIRKKGMSGEKLKIFVSSDAHYSFKKACASMGFGTENLITVPTDKSGKMRGDVLDRVISEEKKQGGTPLFVSATAGTTVLGAFDPIDELSVICKKHGLWLHVDGAWGGPALFSKQTRFLLRGIELADSVTFDAHKLFGASLTSSFFLTQQKGLLLEANDVSGADYLFHSDDPSLDRGKLSWQCGRRADAASFWTIWKSLGTKGLGEFVDKLIGVREQALIWVKTQPRLELVAEPEFLNLCLRIKPPDFISDVSGWSQKVREILKEKNLAMVNYSTDKNGSFLRLIFVHPSIQFQHVKKILEWALEVG